jgi:hypothetical protein
MPEPWGVPVIPFLAGLLLASFTEVFLSPRPAIRQRSLQDWRIHLGIWTLIFMLELLVWQRPWFAGINALALVLLLVVVSNVKQQLLREPFVFMDVEYFTDLLRHPRLYLPFFGVRLTAVLLAVFFAAVYLAIEREPALPGQIGWDGFFWLLGGGFLLAALALLGEAAPMDFDAGEDLRRHGLLSCLWAYALAERKPVAMPDRHWQLPTAKGGEPQPHVVLVQSESFFDARVLGQGVGQQAYAWWDEMTGQSRQQGRLAVPAWGANTVRTEFAVLSGLTSAELGVHAFNPYRKLDLSALTTLPKVMRQAGYRTLCVHPYPGDFYRRDKIMPLLGFDEFMDIDGFAGARRFGPYISDVAVAERVAQRLEESDRPLFVFVITMENHGPLHYEQVSADDRARYYDTPPATDFNDLGVYLRHIENAGRMCRLLQTSLRQNQRPGWLCWYGDHVPVMPEVYAASGFDDTATRYAIWGSSEAAQTGVPAQAVQLSASDLSAALLAGIQQTRAC